MSGPHVVLAPADRGLMWLNSLFLFWLVSVPLPTNLLGEEAMLKSVMNPLLHLIAVSLAWVNPVISIALYAAIPVLFFLPSGLDRAIAAGNRA